MKRTLTQYYGPLTKRQAVGAGIRAAATAARVIQKGYRAYKARKAYSARTKSTQTRVLRTRGSGGPRKLIDGFTTVSSFSNGYRLRPFYRPMLKTAAPSYQIIRFGGRVLSAINQYGNGIYNFLDTGFLQQMYSEIVPNPAASNQRVFVENITINLEFVNAGDQVLSMEIYDILCAKDTNTSPLTAMTNGFSTMDPNTALGQSANQTITAGSLMFSPGMSPTFNQLFKIQKVTKLNIAAGHIHKHTHVFSPRMILNETRRANANFYGGLTKHVLVRVRGQPVTEATNATIVGIGPSTLDVVCMARAKIKYVAANRQTAWTFGGLDLGAVVTPRTMDPVNDAVDTYTAVT